MYHDGNRTLQDEFGSRPLADRLEQTLRPVVAERPGDIRLTNRDTHAHVLLALQDVAVQVPDGATLVRIGKLTLFRGDRAVLLGRNGVGKSLLVRLLLRAATRPEGVPGIRVSPSVVVGYVDQQMSQLPAEASPFGFITDRFRLGDQRSRSLLAGAGFPVDRQSQPISRFPCAARYFSRRATRWLCISISVPAPIRRMCACTRGEASHWSLTASSPPTWK